MKQFLLHILFLLPFFLVAQETREVQILNADKLQFQTNEDGTSVRKMVGNVQLQQETTLMFCDSAYLFKEVNELQAYGNVHIQDSDSVNIYSNELLYFGNEKQAELVGDARLTDGSLELTSDIIYYDMNTKVGSYKEFGTITTDSTVLTSKKGYYFTQKEEAHFSDSVVVVDPNYELVSDTLQFNTQTRVASFYGNTTIFNESSSIQCQRGSYDTKGEIATFGYGTTIYNESQTLYSDSLYYERFRGYGKAMRYFDWKDSDMKAAMTGTDAEYYEENEKIVATQRPLLTVEMDEDSLFVSGDVVIAQDATVNGEKEFSAYPDVRMFKNDLQGICDSMYYTFNDSMFRMYRDPILWNEQSEMKGDTIYAQVAKETIERIRFFENAYIVTQSAGKLFDQVKGTEITGFFRDKKLHKMLSNANAESLYFGKNDADEYVGANQVTAAKMWIYMEEDEISKIKFIDQPDAVFTPMTKLANAQYYLSGFSWNGNLRPVSKFDL